MLISENNNFNRSRSENKIYIKLLNQLLAIRSKRYNEENYISYSLSEDLRRSKAEVIAESKPKI